MSISASLVCHDCQLEFYLGKPLRMEGVPFAFTKGKDPNSSGEYLESNRVVWKMLAAHMRHWIDITIEGYNEREDENYFYIEKGSNFEESASLERFIEDFDDSPERIPGMDWEFADPIPYRPGFFVCYDCKHRLYLGEAIRHPVHIGGIQFFYKDNSEKIPNSKNSVLSQGLWKMMADHAKHHIGVIVGEEGTEDWLKIGEDKEGPLYVSLETYIGDWDWGKTQSKRYEEMQKARDW